jgi:hypothetical protein
MALELTRPGADNQAPQVNTRKIAEALATIPPQLEQIDKKIAKYSVKPDQVVFINKSGKIIGGGNSVDKLETPERTVEIIANGAFNSKEKIGDVTRGGITNGEARVSDSSKLLYDQPISVFVKGKVSAPGSGANSVIIASEDVIFNNSLILGNTKGTIVTGKNFTTSDTIEGNVSAMGRVSATGSDGESKITAGGDVNLTKSPLRNFFSGFSKSLESKNGGEIITGGSFVSQGELHGNVIAAKAVKVISIEGNATVDASKLYLREGAQVPEKLKKITTFIRSKEFDDFTLPKDLPAKPIDPVALRRDIIEQAKDLCKKYDGCDVATDHSGTTFKFPPINKSQPAKSRE